MNRRALVLVAVLSPVFLNGCPKEIPPADGYGDWHQDPAQVAELNKQEKGTNGIEVGAPKFYDDASLKAMLDQTRARLAAVNGLNEAGLINHLGAVTGSTVDQTQIGLQILGPLPPTTTTTDTGSTTSTTSNTGLPTGQTTLPTSSTVTTSPTQSTVSTPNQQTSILPTIPSGLTYTPPATMTGSALDVLNEEMQLNDEIAGYQLLLEGALSDRFVQNENIIKPRTTIGFPISISPQVRYENAVAVVEVEVENPDATVSNEPPTITTILPREKTYNVAALTDNTKSIGGGAVIHAVSIGGSWFGAHRTYYIVQDQDTVALQRPVEQPRDPKKPRATRFAWEFRPVLGEKFVREGLKQTYVQLTLPVVPGKQCFGSLRVHTYWRRFDQKTGLSTEPIEGSALVSTTFSIPYYNLAPHIDDVSYQDLGDGTLLVRVKGQFLAGTYVQLGPTRYDASKNLLFQDEGISFVAPAAAVARWTGYVVSRGGQPTRLLGLQAQDFVPKPNQLACVPPRASQAPDPEAVAQLSQVKVSPDGRSVEIDMRKTQADAATTTLTLVNTQTNDHLKLASVRSAFLQGDQPFITAEAAAATDVCTFGSIRIINAWGTPWGATDTELTVVFDPSTSLDGVLLDVGHKVYGLTDSPVKRDAGAHTITAVVPTALLVAGRGVHAFHPFWTSPEEDDPDVARDACFKSWWPLTEFDIDAPAEKLVLLTVDSHGNRTYLLYGDHLGKIKKAISPKNATFTQIDNASTDRMVFVTITKDDLATTKKLVIQKEDKTRPLVLDLPQPDAKPPKVTFDSPLVLNTERLDVPVERVEDLASVKIGEATIHYVKGKDFVRFTSLRADGVTNEQRTRELVFEYNDGTKVTVKLDVVAQRVGVNN